MYLFANDCVRLLTQRTSAEQAVLRWGPGHIRVHTAKRMWPRPPPDLNRCFHTCDWISARYVRDLCGRPRAAYSGPSGRQSLRVTYPTLDYSVELTGFGSVFSVPLNDAEFSAASVVLCFFNILSLRDAKGFTPSLLRGSATSAAGFE